MFNSIFPHSAQSAGLIVFLTVFEEAASIFQGDGRVKDKLKKRDIV